MMFAPFGYGGGMFLLVELFDSDRHSAPDWFVGAIPREWSIPEMGRSPGQLQHHRRGSGAREILQAANIRDVEVLEINDYLGDHYDPTQKRLCLSSNVYSTPSVAAAQDCRT